MSFRQTLAQYLSQRPSFMYPKLLTREQQAIKEAKAAGLYVRPPGPTSSSWHWEYTGAGKSYGGTVRDFTRSGARAQIKQALGIKKGRLPIGVKLREDKPASA